MYMSMKNEIGHEERAQLTVKAPRDGIKVLDDTLIDEDALGAAPGIDLDGLVCSVDVVRRSISVSLHTKGLRNPEPG